MREPSVSASYFCGLLDLAVSKGAERSVLCRRAGVADAEVNDLDNRIPIEKYLALMRAAKEQCSDPALALHYGETVSISKVSILGLIGQTSKTYMDAYIQAARFARLVVDVEATEGDRFQLRPDSGGLWLFDTRADPNSCPELTETSFAQLVCWCRGLGQTAIWKAARFTHSAPAYAVEYDRILRIPVTFNSDNNAMEVEPALLSEPLASLPGYVFDTLVERANELLRGIDNANIMRRRVENELLPILHTGDIDMETIAAKLEMSRQMLARKLKAENTTFETTLDELRHRMALNYLDAKKTSANETAYLLGFSDQSSFSRAFKRWTGTSPRNRTRPTT